MKNHRIDFRTLFVLILVFCVFPPLMAQQSINVLAIRVEFQPDNSDLTTGDGTFDLTQTPQDSVNIKLDPAPHNRSFFSDHLEYLKNYFDKMTRGDLAIDYDVYPEVEEGAYQLPQPMTYYNPNTTQAQIDEGLARLFYDSWNAAAQDSEIEFDQYDCFFIFHAGVGKDIALVFDETSQDIPSLYITTDFLQNNLPAGLPPLPANIIEGAILPETESQDDYELALNGLVVSNFATFLGLPDMFNASTQRSAVGIFDLMDVGLFNGQGLLPSIPMAWHRIEQGWDNAFTLVAANDSLLRIGNYKQEDIIRIYKFPITSSEYFLVEMRAPGNVFIDSLRYEEATVDYYPNVKEILLGHYSHLVEFSERGVLTDIENLDLGIPGNGILIWHVDDQVIEARIAAGEPINNDQSHKGIDLEEADGSQDIGEEYEVLTAGSGSENGWLLDMFYQENNAPMYEENDGSFSPHTIPASVSNYLNGNSYLTLNDFSQADTAMSFRADFNLYEQGYPLRLPVTESVFMIKAIMDLNGDESPELSVATHQHILFLEAAGGHILDSIRVIDSLLNVLKTDQRDDTFIAITQKTAELYTFNESNFVRTMIDSLTGAEHFTKAAILPGSAMDYLFLGTDMGSFSVFSYNGTQFTRQAEEDLFNNDVSGIYPYLSEADPYVILTSETEQKQFSVSDQSSASLPDITGQYGQITDGWMIEDIGKEVPDFYFLTDQGHLMAWETQDSELKLLKSYENSPFPKYPMPLRAYASEPTRILPVQWNNYGEWITVLAVLGNDLQLVNLNGVPIVSFPRKLMNQTMNGIFTGGYPVLTAGLSSKPEMIYFPALVRVADELENASSSSFGMLIALYGRDGRIQSESYLPFSGNYTSSVLFSDMLPNSSLLAVTDFAENVQILSLFRIPYSAIYNMGYDNLLNYNWPYFKAFPVVSTTSPVSLKGIMPEKLVYNWPNPVKNGFTHIRYYLTQAATVNISIFDQAGFKVWETEDTGSAGMDNEVIWDASGVSSGVYFARVNASYNGKKETKIIKIAIVK